MIIIKMTTTKTKIIIITIIMMTVYKRKRIFVK